MPTIFLLFPVFSFDFYSDKCGFFLTKDEQHKYYRLYTHIRIDFSGIQTLFTGIFEYKISGVKLENILLRKGVLKL